MIRIKVIETLGTFKVKLWIRPPKGCHVALASTLPAQLKPKGVDFILGIGSFGLVYFHDIL